MMGYGYSHDSGNTHKSGDNPHDEVRSDVSQAMDKIERKTERRVANRRSGKKGGDMGKSPLVDGSKVQTFKT